MTRFETVQPMLQVQVNGRGGISRRGLFRSVGTSILGSGLMLGWQDLVIAGASEMRRAGKKMILLWMDGGPSQYDTFNPKIGSKYQGPAGSIPTSLPGVRISEFLPNVASVMDRIAVIRSMSTNEADHARAIKLVRSGYPPNPSVRYPTWGSIVAKEREEFDFDLPAYVRVGKPRILTRDIDSGVLGSRYASFNIDVPGELPADVIPTVDRAVLKRRLALTGRLDAGFASRGAAEAVEQKKAIYERTSRFVLSPDLDAFRLEDEPASLKASYGSSRFGQGCLLARRLIERGVSFVEVFSSGELSDAGWDTHGHGYRDTPNLCAEIDAPYAALLRDLESRGMLADTLVVWMGEFGRTPKIKSDGGRDHYSEGWITCMSGGGIQAGQVIGATDKDGIQVSDRPVTIPDFYVTLCEILGFNPSEEYRTRDDRPIRLVEHGAVIGELFGRSAAPAKHEKQAS